MAFRPEWYQDENSKRRSSASLPDWSAIRWILTVTVAVFLLQAMIANAMQSDVLGSLLGLRAWYADGDLPNGPTSFNFFFPVQLFSYMLVHQMGTLGHLFSNMLFLWILGRDIEPSLGKAGFLRLYLTGGVLGGLAQWIAYLLGGSTVHMIGASGAVYAVMLLAVFRNPQRTIIIFPIPIPIPLWLIVAFFVYSDVGGLLFGGGFVAYLTHLVGGAVGFVWFKRGDLVARAHGNFKRAKNAQKLETKSEDRREMDRILGKIQSEGLSALTKTERTFLNQRSRDLREGR